jgi:hypothetical protein
VGNQLDKVKPPALEAPVDMLGSDVVATAQAPLATLILSVDA